MKKIIVTIFLFLVVKIVTAQILLAILFGDRLNSDKMEFGLAVNPVFTNITGVHGDLRAGLNLALYFKIHMTGGLYLYVEAVAKSAFGEKNIPAYHTGLDTIDRLFSNGKYERKIKAFGMPIMASYGVSKNLFLAAGVRANWMLKSKDIFQTKLYDNDLNYTMNVSDQITTLDFGVTGGLQYKFRSDRRSMSLGVRYYQGLTDIIKTKNGTQSNTALEIVITIPVGGNSKGKTPAP